MAGGAKRTLKAPAGSRMGGNLTRNADKGNYLSDGRTNGRPKKETKANGS